MDETDGGSTANEEYSVGEGGGGAVGGAAQAGGRRGTGRSRRGPAPSMAELNAMMNATGRGRGAKRPPSQRKAPELCVQCDLRPILCRSLCNGCYQKWHKTRKAAAGQGQDVPCPSIAILAARKAAAEAAAAAAMAADEEGSNLEAPLEAAAAAAAAQQAAGARGLA